MSNGSEPTSVPSVDLVRENATVTVRLAELTSSVLDAGAFILGEAVEAVESEIARMSGVTHAVGLASGTDAIALSLRALGIGTGDEVITAANSFIASAGAIVQVGAIPTFADVGPDELIGPEQVEAAITPRTSAIVPVHLRGRPADVVGIRRVADAHGLAVVEDCSQAFLAVRDGHPVGSVGHAGAFSLHPLKNPGVLGDGGIAVTDDAALAARLRILRSHGLRDRDTCLEWGVNSRLDALQAALLLPKLEAAPAARDRRARIADRYSLELADAPLVLPPVVAGAHEAHYSFVVRLHERRDDVLAALQHRGVGALVHYPTPIHLQPAAAALGWKAGSLPATERQAAEILSLPLFSTMTDAEVSFVLRMVSEALAT